MWYGSSSGFVLKRIAVMTAPFFSKVRRRCPPPPTGVTLESSMLNKPNTGCGLPLPNGSNCVRLCAMETESAAGFSLQSSVTVCVGICGKCSAAY